MFYADSSALTKLVVPESESDALRAYNGDDHTGASSLLSITELLRAAYRTNTELDGQARRVLASLLLIDIDRAVLKSAATLASPALRTLDAIHVTTALTLGRDLDAVLTYDTRMSKAARSTGFRVKAPV